MSDAFKFEEPRRVNSILAAGFSEKPRLKVNAAAVQTSEVFTGGGVDDMTPAGTYTGIKSIIYKVLIDAEGAPDTITWFKDGVVQATGVAVTGSAQNLDLGVTVNFGGTDNHDIDDFWEFEATITTDWHKVVQDSMAHYLRLSLDQKVWYKWLALYSAPVAGDLPTQIATADNEVLQSNILPAANAISMAIPWGLQGSVKQAGTLKDLYLIIEKHTSDAVMQIAEV